MGGGERTSGDRHVESILPGAVPVYVLGIVQKKGKSARRRGRGGTVLDQLPLLGTHEEKFRRDALWPALIALGLFVFGVIFIAVGVAAAVGVL